MKAERFIGRWLPLAALCSLGIVSCANVGTSLAVQDMDRDGAVSESEYRRSQMQYNMASRQRTDEISRARLATNHLGSVAGTVDETDRLTDLLRNFGNGKSTKIVPDAKELKPSVRNPGSKPKAVPDPKELKTPAKDL